MARSDDPTTTISRSAQMFYPVERVLFDRLDMSPVSESPRSSGTLSCTLNRCIRAC